MRVLSADKLAPVATERLRAAGHYVVLAPTLKGAALEAGLLEHRPDVLVVRSTRVEAAHLEAIPGLTLVVRAGAGVNTIDLEAAGSQGVYVCNCPGKNAAAVAELAMGLIVALDRRLPDNIMEARAGRWDKATFSKAAGLKGRVLGLLGLGRIGREVALRAQAFGMTVVAWSRSLDERTAVSLGVQRAATPLEVARRCDVLSVHLAACPDTEGLVDAELLGAMREGALLVNTSRSEVVDEVALLQALDAGAIRAGLDVFAGEPSAKSGALDSPLARHSGVYLTHHIGASTEQAQISVASEVARVVEVFATTGDPPNCVNLVAETSAEQCLIVRHRDQVGALASVLDALSVAGINVQEMSNTIFTGGKAAVARLHVHGDAAQVMDGLSALPAVLHVACVPVSRRGDP
jgi:D-3-phosphoglycerate dehydrogenase